MRRPRAALLAGALALALFAPAAWWGLPNVDARGIERGWAIDDETPLGALAEVSHIVRPGTGGERNLGYPLFYYLASAAAYSPYMAYLWASGGMGTPTEEYPYGLSDATHAIRVMALLSRCLTLLFGVAVVVGVFRIGESTWNRRTAMLGAALASVAYPLAYYARTGNVDVPMLGLTVLGLAAYATIIRDGVTTKRAVWLGVCAGLAVATKDSAVGIFLGVLLALPAMPASATESSIRARVRAWGIAAVVAVAALVIGSGAVFDPGRYLDHLRFLGGRLESLPGESQVRSSLPMTMAGHVAYARFVGGALVQMLTLPGLVLAIGGLGWFVSRDRRSRLLALPLLTYGAFMFFFLRAAQLRYLLPLVVLLALFAAALVDAGLRSPRRLAGAAAAALLVAALSIGLLRVTDLTHAMWNDSRHDASRWLAATLVAGDRIEYFGASQKLPRLPVGVSISRSIPYRGMHAVHDTSAAVADSIVAGWIDRRPRLVLVIPDHTSPTADAPYDASVPPALYRALEAGTLPYRRVALFQTPSLIPWIRRPPLDYPMVNPSVRIYAP